LNEATTNVVSCRTDRGAGSCGVTGVVGVAAGNAVGVGVRGGGAEEDVGGEIGGMAVEAAAPEGDEERRSAACSVV